MSATKLVALAACVSVCGACRGTAGPKQWLATPQQMPTSTYGGWFDPGPGADSSYAGELIAVRNDSLWILTAAGTRIVGRNHVPRATVIGWNSGASDMMVTGTLGSLSTLSNGLFSIFTMPAWILTTSVASASQARRPEIQVLGASAAELSIFARFPQGLPPGIRLETLRMKVPTASSNPRRP